MSSKPSGKNPIETFKQYIEGNEEQKLELAQVVELINQYNIKNAEEIENLSKNLLRQLEEAKRNNASFEKLNEIIEQFNNIAKVKLPKIDLSGKLDAQPPGPKPGAEIGVIKIGALDDDCESYFKAYLKVHKTYKSSS